MALQEPRQSVYRIRVKYRGRRLPWRVIDVLGAMSINAFDRYLRTLFQLEEGDKLSAFYRGSKLVYAVDPWEQVDPGVVEGLFQGKGDRLGWVYDAERGSAHQLIVVDIATRDPDAAYPLLLRASHPEYRTCACGVTPATWYCDTCSEQEGMLVALCEDCLAKRHLTHRVSRVVY